MAFNETILGALIIGVLVGGAILLTGSGSTIKHRMVAEDRDKHWHIEEAIDKENAAHIVIRKELSNVEDEYGEQPTQQALKNRKEVRVQLHLDDADLDPVEIAEKIEKALQSGLRQLPFDFEVSITATSE